MIRRANLLPALTVLALVGVLAISTTVALGGPAPAEVVIRGCPVAHASPPRTAHLHRPPQTVARSARLMAIVKTNCGRFQIRLDARRAPITVNSFVYLARSGFYRGLDFYRVVQNFVIQAGDPRLYWLAIASSAGDVHAALAFRVMPPRHKRRRRRSRQL